MAVRGSEWRSDAWVLNICSAIFFNFGWIYISGLILCDCSFAVLVPFHCVSLYSGFPNVCYVISRLSIFLLRRYSVRLEYHPPYYLWMYMDCYKTWLYVSAPVGGFFVKSPGNFQKMNVYCIFSSAWSQDYWREIYNSVETSCHEYSKYSLALLGSPNYSNRFYTPFPLNLHVIYLPYLPATVQS